MTLEEKIAKLKDDAVKQLSGAGVTDLDHDLLSKLAGNLKLVIDNKDALLVSATDDAELETVRRNFAVKKLGVEDKDTAMAAIKETAAALSSYKFKNRVAFYYMVQQKLS